MRVGRKAGGHNYISDFTKSIVMKEFLSKLLKVKSSTIQETMSKMGLLPSNIDNCVEFLQAYIKHKYDRNI